MKNKEIISNTCTFTGHRPQKLYGYNLDNPKYQQLAKCVAKELRLLIENRGVRFFISGGAIGFDTVAFFVVEKMKREYPTLGIKNILAIPFENQFIKWNETDKERYIRMKNLADDIVYVDTLSSYQVKNDSPTGHFSNIKMQKRNEYMVDNSSYIVALWDGERKGGTYNCLEYVYKQKDFNKTIIVNPSTLKVKHIEELYKQNSFVGI
jgi:uncharacterized phage-like protein YoqJ